MVHSKQYVVEYILSVIGHRLGQTHVSELVTCMVAENCQWKNPYFKGKIVLFVIIFSFYLYILFYLSCEFNELAAKPKFVAQSRPALYSYSQ